MILTVGAVAAGGSCVARADDGRVVFVRHALPGETVRVEVRSSGSRFLRADAVEILTPSPDRVVPPCPFAGPGRCGGCDWQHASPSLQLELKAALVSEQLTRVARFAWDVAVEPVEPLLHWRTRVQWAVSSSGTPGLHRHRSRDLELVSSCAIAAPGVETPLGHDWSGARSVEAFALEEQTVLTVEGRPRVLPAVDAGVVVAGQAVRGPHGVRLSVGGRSFEVSAGRFWQVHPAAASVLSSAVLSGLEPRPGESVVDLYAGVGLFASLLGAAVGPSGSVTAVEGDARACADAARNTADQPWVTIRTSLVTPSLVSSLRPSLVVLDPPRAGAGLEVSSALASLRPRALAYVSCDPATFARDLRVFLDAAWTVASLRAFDLYPQTEHVELVTVLHPPT
ncbi:MAG: rRNA methyltransferase/RumA [Frankiales bacterium]|nr:rRNA methyltransferase/RumA [Frankiales bacterium]